MATVQFLGGMLATAVAGALGMGRRSGPQTGSAHDFAFQGIDGQPLPLARFAGQAILLVNTASRCGFTRQYRALQALWQEHAGRGLVVLGVPSNDFGGQEPGGEAEIAAFCTANFGIDFPLARKERVVGTEAHPFYRWAGLTLGAGAAPRWNFHKYLIDRNGRLVDWFAPATAPDAARLRAAVERALA